jgi:hypothetical protein
MASSIQSMDDGFSHRVVARDEHDGVALERIRGGHQTVMAVICAGLLAAALALIGFDLALSRLARRWRFTALNPSCNSA